MSAPEKQRPSGADAAFATFVVPEIEVLYRVARARTDSPADVEDLVQDSLLRAFRAIERFDGRHPRAWLLTIMRNAHISEIRRKKPSLLRDDDIERRPSRSGERRRSAEQEVMDQHFEHHVEVAYRSLTPRFREVIDLVDLGGLS